SAPADGRQLRQGGPMDSSNPMRPGDISICPILGTAGWYIYGEILATPAGPSYSQLGLSGNQGEAVELARKLCELDGVGLIWLFGADGRCTQVPQFPGADIPPVPTEQ